FTLLQTQIHEKCPDEYTTLVMLLCMMRIANRSAARDGAQALVTGESLGQVASQTMEAIVCTDMVAGMPVFRPLIGDDKLDIIREAEKIGTYETSSLPYEDCCTVFTPRHPVTRPRPEKAALAEQPLHEGGWLEEMIGKAALEAEALDVAPTGDEGSLSRNNT
ncbi:MAG TPA: tRNA 4-thiouridine(8) synthase ThiI, partial [Candidatus Limnocylindria bacterium]|nr:tRNA 4-thiouridine(8) synthase ThiI [Candidatus Limnocylindria bacterium]